MDIPLLVVFRGGFEVTRARMHQSFEYWFSALIGVKDVESREAGYSPTATL